jgi:peptide/nickel transport system substrate-binding protein
LRSPVTETGLDDPYQMFYEHYFCGSERNYTGYCNAEVDRLIDQQSVQTDTGKRRQTVWQIEYLAEDGRRPIIFHPARSPAHIHRSREISVGSTTLTIYGA